MTRTHDHQIKAAYDKGNSPAVIAKLLDHKLDYVNSVLGLDAPPEPRAQASDYTPEALEAVASEALYILACEVHANPAAFKPPEALAIIREALDRTKGKAAQTLSVETKGTVTHAHVMSIEPADAYRLLVEGRANITGLPIIDVTPEAGGMGENTGAGVSVREDPTHNTHPLDGF